MFTFDLAILSSACKHFYWMAFLILRWSMPNEQPPRNAYFSPLIMRRAWGHWRCCRYLHCKLLKLGRINLMQQTWYFKPLFSKALTDSIKWSLSLNPLLNWSLNYSRNEQTVVGAHSSETCTRLMSDFHHAVLHTLLFPYRKDFSSFNFLLQTHLFPTPPGALSPPAWVTHAA